MLAAAVTAVAALAAWAWGPQVWSAVAPSDPGEPRLAAAHLASATASPTASPSASSGVSPGPTSTDDAAGTAATSGATASPDVSAPALPKGLTEADVSAGLRSTKVPGHGDGTLHTVSGTVEAPGKGRVHTVRVRVEGGLGVDPKKFAGFVLRVLNDDRSWGHGGTMTFARTDRADADITVVLASPDLSASMCRPLVTYGTLSCRQGDQAILTLYRWAKAIPDYGKDRTGYRRYVVNHEVGHALGHAHQYCPGKGRIAPVMMQQTKGLGVCRPNSWPFP